MAGVLIELVHLFFGGAFIGISIAIVQGFPGCNLVCFHQIASPGCTEKGITLPE
jgi:hypothetical protein